MEKEVFEFLEGKVVVGLFEADTRDGMGSGPESPTREKPERAKEVADPRRQPGRHGLHVWPRPASPRHLREAKGFDGAWTVGGEQKRGEGHRAGDHHET